MNVAKNIVVTAVYSILLLYGEMMRCDVKSCYVMWCDVKRGYCISAFNDQYCNDTGYGTVYRIVLYYSTVAVMQSVEWSSRYRVCDYTVSAIERGKELFRRETQQ
jgi:hypothetical protein